MKLLFDENLSARLVRSLALVYPGSQHVEAVGLDGADDSAVWDFAKGNGFTIVSKDSDFYDRSALYGSPPKVVWLRVGNCSTDSVATLLLRAQAKIQRFVEHDSETCLILSLRLL